jgi:hypothetical protein
MYNMTGLVGALGEERFASLYQAVMAGDGSKRTHSIYSERTHSIIREHILSSEERFASLYQAVMAGDGRR